MKRILIIKMWALGDILMATPLLRTLKRQYPDCSITWIAEAGHADVLKGNPMIDEVIGFDSGAWRRHLRYFRLIPYYKISFEMQHRLKAKKFDIVINLTGEKWWSVWFAVAPVRIGLFPSEKIGWIRHIYTTAIARTKDPWLHSTRHYLLPAEALGIPGPYDERMVIGVPDEDRKAVDEFLKAQPEYDPSKPLVVLHPGSSRISKSWLSDSFAGLVEILNDRFNVVITGSPKERPLADAICRDMKPGARKPIVASGQLTSISQTSALIERAAAAVSGDTSALHITSAFGTPLIGIYGSTRPHDNAPLFGKMKLLFDDSIPCAPCYKHPCPLSGEKHMACMKAITPEMVAAAIEELTGIAVVKKSVRP